MAPLFIVNYEIFDSWKGLRESKYLYIKGDVFLYLIIMKKKVIRK